MAPVLRPDAYVCYPPEKKVGDDISKVSVEKAASKASTAPAAPAPPGWARKGKGKGKYAPSTGSDPEHDTFRIDGLVKGGPAYTAGVRSGWVLDVRATVAQELGKAPSRKELLATDSSPLLERAGVTLIFRQPHPSPEMRFMGCGPEPDTWKSLKVPGDTVQLTFSCDVPGSFSENADHRWGVWALAVPSPVLEEPKDVEFSIAIEQPEGSELGLDLEGGDSPTSTDLLVCCVKDGLVSDFNAQNQAQQVMVGDRIVEVNGIKGSGKTIHEELKKPNLTIALKRGTAPLCKRGHSLKPLDFPFGRPPCAVCKFQCSAYVCEDCNYDLCHSCYQRPRQTLLPPTDGFDEFVAKWVQASQKALGIQDTPVVDTMGWNENRLRQLCARHGWEFEWMAEDGERRRRARERRELWRMKDVPRPAPSALDVPSPDGARELGSE